MRKRGNWSRNVYVPEKGVKRDKEAREIMKGSKKP